MRIKATLKNNFANLSSRNASLKIVSKSKIQKCQYGELEALILKKPNEEN